MTQVELDKGGASGGASAGVEGGVPAAPRAEGDTTNRPHPRGLPLALAHGLSQYHLFSGRAWFVESLRPPGEVGMGLRGESGGRSRPERGWPLVEVW